MNAGAAPSSSAVRGALAAAMRWRLPFSRQAWRGLSGNWLGAGAGSSLDFQDHRVYVPGDDPRHIHWQAYARTGALTMKLYRAEVAPFVDIAIDTSASMTFEPAKAARTDELLAFCVTSADRAAAPVRIHAVCGRTVLVAAEDVRADRWRERLSASASTPAGADAAPGPVPWRPGALKVLISDLLFPGDPAVFLDPLASGAGAAVVFAPVHADEVELPWRGNLELQDCETGACRNQRIDAGLAERYRRAYERHFELWREAARRRRVLFARVPCQGTLAAALAGDAFAAFAVEVVN